MRDLNGNGAIDKGAELMGVDTVKRDNTKAKDGFDALADLDSNQDGVMNAQDTAFASLRIWRDLNQDGISQPGELQTLAQAGIVSINVSGEAAQSRPRLPPSPSGGGPGWGHRVAPSSLQARPSSLKK